MKLGDFATELSNLVERARANDISADDVRDAIQSVLDNIEDDEEEESEEDT